MPSHLRRCSTLRRVSLSCVVVLSITLLGCGSGGGSDGGGGGGGATTEVTLLNNLLTFGGQTNLAPITGYRLTNTSTLQVVTASGLDIQPGDSITISVAPGSYNTLVTYFDGDHETAQSPGDAVVLAAATTTTITFLR